MWDMDTMAREGIIIIATMMIVAATAIIMTVIIGIDINCKIFG